MKNPGKHIPAVNRDERNLLPHIRIFALDLDGTVYLGTKWIEGAKEFLEAITRTGRDYYFLTNNSSKNPKVYVEKLAGMGFATTLDHIITSGQATIWYLQKHFSEKRVFLLGNDMLQEEFRESGIVLDEKNPEVVVTGFDTSLTYEKMCRICDFVRAGLPYIATHPDYNCPTENGFIPDIGAIAAFIRASAFRDPDVVVGKPNALICDYLMERIHEANQGFQQVARSQIAMVGDRLYTDVAAGINGGLTSILVLSGEASLEDAEAAAEVPDLIFDSVAEIPL